MSENDSVRVGRWLFVLAIAVMLAPACGGGRKKYLDTVLSLVEQNDRIDAKIAKLPKTNAYKDPDYLEKIDSSIGSKQALLGQLEIMEPPFLMAGTHARLIQAMKNGIRFLQSEREKFTIAAEKMAKQYPMQNQIRGTEEDDIIRQYQSQTAAYQADMKEQLMKKQYERLYGEVKDELERASKF